MLDMLFTGNGEAFNVRVAYGDIRSEDADLIPRSDNSSKMYRPTHGQVWGLACA